MRNCVFVLILQALLLQYNYAFFIKPYYDELHSVFTINKKQIINPLVLQIELLSNYNFLFTGIDETKNMSLSIKEDEVVMQNIYRINHYFSLLSVLRSTSIPSQSKIECINKDILFYKDCSITPPQITRGGLLDEWNFDIYDDNDN